MKTLIALTTIFCLSFVGFAQDDTFDLESLMGDSISIETLMELEYLNYVDSVESSLNWQHGTIILGDDLATLTIPDGYKYLDSPSSHTVLEELWGNPEGETLGMIFKEDEGAMTEVFSYAVNITFEEEGWVDDDDAEDLDFEDIMEGMQDDQVLENEWRIENGYETMDLLGWASEPFYDQEHRVLHWALDLHVQDAEINTLNYNIKKLGRRGYLTFNAIGDMDALAGFTEEMDNILYCSTFNDGHKYEDFNPDIDTVAAVGIGGLIAGKVLAKTGLIAIIIKAWKFILIGIIAAWGTIKAFFRKKEKNAALPEVQNEDDSIS